MITLGELAADLVALTSEQGQISIVGISADSRQVKPGFLFAALAGTHVDGAKFVRDAVANGASGVVVGNDVDVENIDAVVMRVDDPRLTLAQMAARFFAKQPETMVAVTGTAGKTSVAEFTRQIWQGCGRQSAFIGTTGVVAEGRKDYGNLTTPDPVTLHRLLDELASNGVTHGAIEASSHGLDQKRLHGVRLSAAGFTNLGRDHLDYHVDMDDYFRAKMELFRGLLPKGSPAVMFADDPYSDRAIEIAKEAGHQVLTVGRRGEFLSLKRVEHERYQQVAEIMHAGKNYRVQFPLAGDFQISNGLVAAGLALSTGENIDNVMARLEVLKGASGRLELIGHNKNGAPVYVDYAHKPEALENILMALRPFAARNLVLVFGCGGDRDPGKRSIMGEIGARLADTVIVTDDNPRTENAAEVRKAIMAAAPGATEIGDRHEAIKHAVDSLQEGDCLVVAGKGHETGQIVGDKILKFSDHDEIRKALKANPS